LEKAETLQPDRPGPHLLLSKIYSQLGREEDAKRELAELERLGVAPDASLEVPADNNVSNPK
jgi:Flp pilus assembly protein TadD